MMGELFIATIDHKNGVNTYISTTERGLTKQIDSYVKEWWESEDLGFPMPEDMDDRIDQYFAAVSQEYIYYTTVELPDSEELLEAAKNMLANLEDSSMHKNPETGEEYTDYVRLRNAVMAFGKNQDETRSYKSSLV